MIYYLALPLVIDRFECRLPYLFEVLLLLETDPAEQLQRPWRPLVVPRMGYRLRQRSSLVGMCSAAMAPVFHRPSSKDHSRHGGDEGAPDRCVRARHGRGTGSRAVTHMQGVEEAQGSKKLKLGNCNCIQSYHLPLTQLHPVCLEVFIHSYNLQSTQIATSLYNLKLQNAFQFTDLGIIVYFTDSNALRIAVYILGSG
jgi:hypothetical protein